MGNTNNSSKFMGALGPGSWAASGGMRSSYQQTAGLMNQDHQSSTRDDLAREISALDAAAAARGFAQQAAMRQRSEGTLLRPALVEMPSGTEPRAESSHVRSPPPQRCESDTDLRKPAAAHQLNAVRPRGAQTLIKVGKMTAGEIEAAKLEGGTKTGSANSSAASRAAQFGRKTMLEH